MFDCSNIVKSEYVDFFTRNIECTGEETIIYQFLGDMETICENIKLESSPVKIMFSVFEKNKHLLDVDDMEIRISVDNINALIKSDVLFRLSKIELFAFLWYCSCKNILLYEHEYYLKMINNGVIGALIKRLSEISGLEI